MTPKELQVAASFRIAGPRGRGVVLGLGNSSLSNFAVYDRASTYFGRDRA